MKSNNTSSFYSSRSFTVLIVLIITTFLSFQYFTPYTLVPRFGNGAENVANSVLPCYQLPFNASCPESKAFVENGTITEEKDCLSSQVLQVDYRRRLAEKIAKVQLDIARLAGSGNVDAKWAHELSEIVAELDPRRSSSLKSSSEDWDFSARQPDMGPAPKIKSDGQSRNVCPEVYKFQNEYNLYFQIGTYQENCTYVPEFKETLTVLLPSQSWSPAELKFIAERIAKFYDISILALVKNASGFINPMPETLSFLEVRNRESDSELLSRAIKLVKTPFVLIGNSLNQFNDQASLERLVRVLDDLPLVKIAGGAARDSQGRWIHGCLQQKMENYHASYDQGYYSSKYECMYCDDLLTPFVTHTKLFKQIPLEKGLNTSIAFHDWFVRVRYAGHLAVTCPDVMFYVNAHPKMTTSDWRKFGQKYSLSRIKSYNDTVLDFPCSEVNIECKGMGSLVKSYLIPPCCLKLIREEIGYILDFADQNNLHYEMQAGTVLGAVKMGDHLPWDLDMDFIFSCNDYDKWMKIKNLYLKKRNCNMVIHKKNIYFAIYCPTLFYEFICRKSSGISLSRHLMPKEFIDIPTKINFGGRWTSAQTNPGHYSRNKYGMEDLRHAPHWRFLKKESSTGQYDNPGAWNKCIKPNHHACLDRFPADGSLAFVFR